jgi:hypothetical protein
MNDRARALIGLTEKIAAHPFAERFTSIDSWMKTAKYIRWNSSHPGALCMVRLYIGNYCIQFNIGTCEKGIL